MLPTSVKFSKFCDPNSDGSPEESVSFKDPKEGSHQVYFNSPELDRYDQGAYNFCNLPHITLASSWKLSVFHRALRRRRRRRPNSFPKKGRF